MLWHLLNWLDGQEERLTNVLNLVVSTASEGVLNHKQISFVLDLPDL